MLALRVEGQSEGSPVGSRENMPRGTQGSAASEQCGPFRELSCPPAAATEDEDGACTGALRPGELAQVSTARDPSPSPLRGLDPPFLLGQGPLWP